jgi:hypothetical protein
MEVDPRFEENCRIEDAVAKARRFPSRNCAVIYNDGKTVLVKTKRRRKRGPRGRNNSPKVLVFDVKPDGNLIDPKQDYIVWDSAARMDGRLKDHAFASLLNSLDLTMSGVRGIPMKDSEWNAWKAAHAEAIEKAKAEAKRGPGRPKIDPVGKVPMPPTRAARVAAQQEEQAKKPAPGNRIPHEMPRRIPRSTLDNLHQRWSRDFPFPIPQETLFEENPGIEEFTIDEAEKIVGSRHNWMRCRLVTPTRKWWIDIPIEVFEALDVIRPGSGKNGSVPQEEYDSLLRFVMATEPFMNLNKLEDKWPQAGDVVFLYGPVLAEDYRRMKTAWDKIYAESARQDAE